MREEDDVKRIHPPDNLSQSCSLHNDIKHLHSSWETLKHPLLRSREAEREERVEAFTSQDTKLNKPHRGRNESDTYDKDDLPKENKLGCVFRHEQCCIKKTTDTEHRRIYINWIWVRACDPRVHSRDL